MQRPLVIIGTGLAGYTLAKEFRKYDTEKPLYLITQDAGEFYSKPLLSTSLSQQRQTQQLTIATAAQMQEQLNATLLTHTQVTHIDAEQQIIYFEQQNLAYDKLVLALGANVIKPDLTGNAVQEIYSVNNLDQYAQFRQKLTHPQKIAILGAGLVGCEFANDLMNAGHQIHIIAPNQYPLERWAPPAVGKVLQRALGEKGVNWYLGPLAERIEKNKENYVLTLNNQQQVEADIVLSAIGLLPHTQLAQKAGLVINRGIRVDHYLKTSANNIYAIGDCAEVNGFILFFVAPLLQCARALAKTLANQPEAVKYPAMPIVLKTPICPMVLLPPSPNLKGHWEVIENGSDVKALFYTEDQKLYGFALTGQYVPEKNQLIKEIPAWL